MDAGSDEHGGPGDDTAVCELDTGEVVVFDHQSRDLTGHDRNASGIELVALGVGQVISVDEECDVGGPLTNEQSVLDGAGN
ncbi:MAG: hypothetical protein ABIP03_14090 [Aquihabitans sp.]